MLFETMIWHDQVHKDYSWAADGKLFSEDHHYMYMPHISGEYSYRLLPWMNLGLSLNFQETGWHRECYDNSGVMKNMSRENFWNLCLMPVVRFNYFRREHVEIYSSISAGMDINGGSEKNGFGQNTVCGFAADLRLVGVSAGSGHWWGFAEFGGLYALRNKDTMFLMNSEMIRVGISYVL